MAKAVETSRKGKKTDFRAVPVVVPGEASSVFFAFPKRARHFNREGFATVFLAEIGRLAEDRTMLAQEFRVLLCIIRDLEYGNLWSPPNYSKIASRIGMQRQNLHAIVKRLEKRNILISMDTAPNTDKAAASKSSPKTYRRAYRLNRRLAWRGKGEGYLDALKGEPEIIAVARDNKKKKISSKAQAPVSAGLTA